MKITRVPVRGKGVVALTLPSDTDILQPFIAMLTVAWSSGATTVAGLRCLVRVAVNEGLTHSEYAALTGFPKYTVSKCLRNLEEQGLVEQRRSEENRREVRAYLTARGKQVRARIVGEARKVVRETRAKQLREARLLLLPSGN